MSDFVVAAQLFSLRDYLKTPEDIESTLKKVADMGYKCVQISGVGEIDPYKLKEILDKNGLTVCCTHMAFDKLKDDLDSVIHYHKVIGCDVVGLGMMPKEWRESGKEGYLEFCKFANELNEKLKAEGLCFAYHNHANEFEKFDGKLGFDIILDETDIGFIPDVHWILAGGVFPHLYLDKIGSRTKTCHLKDYTIVKGERKFAALGDGTIDFVPILNVLKKHGIKYLAIEQDDCYGEDPFMCLKKSLDYINGVIENN